MSQENIGKVQVRHVNLSNSKVQPQHGSRFPLVCLIVKIKQKIFDFSLSKYWFRQGNPDMSQENIGKVQVRHVNLSNSKVQPQHGNRFPLVCLIQEIQKKFFYFSLSKYWFRQPNPDMCQKKIGKVQPRHADFSIRKVQPRHVSRFPSVCLIVKIQTKISNFSFWKYWVRQGNPAALAWSNRLAQPCARKRLAKCNPDMPTLAFAKCNRYHVSNTFITLSNRRNPKNSIHSQNLWFRLSDRQGGRSGAILLRSTDSRLTHKVFLLSLWKIWL